MAGVISIVERIVALTARAFWIVAGVVLAVILMIEINDRAVIIEEISVPAELADRGYTPSVVAHQLLEEWRVIDETALTTRRRREIGLGSGRVDLAVPGFNLSLNTIVDYLKNLIGAPRERVRGGIVAIQSQAPECAEGCYTMFLSLEGRSVRRLSLTAPATLGVEEIIRRSSRAMMEELDPYLLANFYYSADPAREPARESEMLRLIDVVLAEPPARDDPWALTLLGVYHNRNQRWAEALTHLDRALQLDRTLAPALNSRCWAKGHLPGRAEEAIADCREALRLNPDSYQTMDSLAYALEQTGDRARAFRVILCARRISEGDPDIETTYARLRTALPNADATPPDEAACAALMT